MKLGQPIPDELHAVSVSLPTWADVKGYEEGLPHVINAMQLGYPRFVYHPLVKKLAADCEQQFAGAGEFCLPLPSKRSAELCVKYCGEGEVNEYKGIYAVTLPEAQRKKAKEFWQHSGYIVTSRLAESVLNGKATTPTNAKEKIKEKLESLSGAATGNIYFYPTGMAAIFNAFEALGSGKTIQLGFPYVDTFKIQQRFGKTVFVDYDLQKFEAAIKEHKPVAVFTEFPLNPLLTCIDLEEVSRICRENSVVLVVDDTLSTWANIDVLEYADIAVTSLTKFYSGVGNVTGGSLILNAESPFYGRLKTALAAVYEDILFEADAIVLEENGRDFEKRIAKINSNAEKFAKELKSKYPHAQILYPKGDAIYEKYKKKSGGYGGIISVIFPTETEAQKYFDALECNKGPSLGTNYTLACPYTMLAHYYERDFIAQAKVPFQLIRFSVGVE